MGDSEQTLVRLSHQIADIPAADWDACHDSANPFIHHAFLSALEASGCVSAQTGWLPCHLTVEHQGRLLGCAPMYLKDNSHGEYVFDHSWAAAFERAGGNYYPKLQIAVPFTPVTGPRLLCREERDRVEIERALISGAIQAAEQYKASSLHITFPTAAEWDSLGGMGLLQRADQQFHWENRGYQSFGDFLAGLASRKRKAILKERRQALASGVTIEVVTGDSLRAEHWDAFHSFYMDTGSRKWGRPYLNRDFFGRLGETMADQVVLFLCSRDGRYVAGALNMRGADTLYGRYWGCLEDHRFLHFETCYYQAMDFAIEHGLARVEAGAQGPHKLSRGYVPSRTHSAHWIANPGLRQAIAQYLDQERDMVDSDMEFLTDRLPFKKG